MSSLAEILNQFGVEADALPHGNGHINRTYLVDSSPRVILQRINTAVFHKPEEVMENIMAVTSFIKAKVEAEGMTKHIAIIQARADGSLLWLDLKYVVKSNSKDELDMDV